MTDTTASTGDQAADQAAATAAAAAATAAGHVIPRTAEPEADSVDKLPKWAQKLVGDLRDKDAKGRIALTAAEQRQKDILKAAGIETDETDPGKIAEAAQKERDAAQKDARDTKVELAVYRLSGGAGADPLALLDSRAFLTKLDKADPEDSDGIKSLITDWVKDNPKFKQAARAAGTSGADFSGGTGEQRQSAAHQAAPGTARLAAAYATPQS